MRASFPDRIHTAVAAALLLSAALAVACSSSSDGVTVLQIDGLTNPLTAFLDQVVLVSGDAFLPTGGGETLLTATVFSSEGKPLADVKVIFETTAGELVPSNTAGTNQEGRATVTLRATARAVVKARVSTVESEALLVDIDSPVDLKITGPSQLTAGQTTEFTISATREDGFEVRGTVDVDFGDGQSNTIQGFVNTATISHKYAKAGTYKVTVKLTQIPGMQSSGSTSIKVSDPIKITLQVVTSPAVPIVDQATTFTITATREDGSAGKGKLVLDYGDGDSDTIANFSSQATRTHTYTSAGSFKAVVDLTEANGSDASTSLSLTVNKPVATGQDELDLSQVKLLHANVTTWPQTSTITSVKITTSQVCVNHTKAGKWPVKVLSGVAVEGNPWVFAKIGGQWYGATYEWLRPGQICKGITAGNIGGHIKVSPLATWKPKKGEVVGFMIATLSRDGNRTSNERSNVMLVTWPY